MNFSDIFSSITSLFSLDINIDGTPMLPDSCIDINGNAYGITDSVLNSAGGIFDSSGSFSSLDS